MTVYVAVLDAFSTFIRIKSRDLRSFIWYFLRHIKKNIRIIFIYHTEGPVSAARRTGYGDGWRAGRPRRRGLFNFRALRAQAAAWPMLKGSPSRYLPRYYRREEIEEGGIGEPLRGNEKGVTLSRSSGERKRERERALWCIQHRFAN